MERGARHPPRGRRAPHRPPPRAPPSSTAWLADGEERAILERLRRKLGITPETAEALERDVREARGVR